MATSYCPRTLDSLKLAGYAATAEARTLSLSLGVVKWGFRDRLCLVGNIDLHYTLTLGTPEEVDAEVKQRIETIGVGGGYMISSANSITSYCKIENVCLMIETIRKYGAY